MALGGGIRRIDTLLVYKLNKLNKHVYLKDENRPYKTCFYLPPSPPPPPLSPAPTLITLPPKNVNISFRNPTHVFFTIGKSLKQR